MLRALLPKMVNAPIHFGCCNYTTVQKEKRRPDRKDIAWKARSIPKIQEPQ